MPGIKRHILPLQVVVALEYLVVIHYFVHVYMYNNTPRPMSSLEPSHGQKIGSFVHLLSLERPVTPHWTPVPLR